MEGRQEYIPIGSKLFTKDRMQIGSNAK